MFKSFISVVSLMFLPLLVGGAKADSPVVRSLPSTEVLVSQNPSELSDELPSIEESVDGQELLEPQESLEQKEEELDSELQIDRKEGPEVEVVPEPSSELELDDDNVPLQPDREEVEIRDLKF